MPFTISHAAAVLPFRKVGFITSAFVIGTFGPDFGYFILLAPRTGLGHKWPGVVEFTLPACLFVLWVFHSFVKRPVAALLPSALERRVEPYLGTFRFGGVRRFCLIVLSVMFGIATHIFWDLFTHPGTPVTLHSPFLMKPIWFPILGTVPLCKLLQHGSTVAGLVVLVLWFWLWLQSTRSVAEAPTYGLRPSSKLMIAVLSIAVAAVGGVVRTALFRVPAGTSAVRVGVLFGVTSISVFCASLLIYAAWWNWIRRLS